MPTRFVDPFFPNRPVDDPDRFAGRKQQVDEAIDSLYQIANNNPKHSIITGDRGVGKSSLLLQIRRVAEGNSTLPTRLAIDTGSVPFNFITAWHDSATDQDVGILASGLLRDVQSQITALLERLDLELNLGGLIRIGQKSPPTTSISDIVHAFCAEVAKAMQRVKKGKKSGLLFFVDEVDRLPTDKGIATFFKLASEKLSRDGIKNVGFFCAGITGALQKLEEEHASIFRTFRDILLPRLEPSEIRDILESGFKATNVTFDNQVVTKTVKLCAGFPEPVHIVGSEMLSVDTDDHIDVKDFDAAKDKVVKDVRRNKLESALRQAGSGRYKDILVAMAKHPDINIPLSAISSALQLEQNQYSVNMGTLVDKDVIARVDRGVYTFVDPLLREYILAFDEPASDT